MFVSGVPSTIMTRTSVARGSYPIRFGIVQQEGGDLVLGCFDAICFPGGVFCGSHILNVRYGLCKKNDAGRLGLGKRAARVPYSLWYKAAGAACLVSAACSILILEDLP